MISIQSTHPIRGFVFGLHYPSLRTILSITDSDYEKNLVAANHILSLVGSNKIIAIKENESEPNYHIFTQIIDEIINLTNWPIFQKTILISVKQSSEYLFLIPCINDGFHSINCLVRAISNLLNIGINKKLFKKDCAELLAVINKMKNLNVNDSNTKNFIKAAVRLKIPFTPLANGLYQFGYCSESRRLNSSLTDKTPQISTAIAKNKFVSSNILKNSGFPTPRHFIVHDIASAIQAANSLQYPVVIKPQDLDRGEGVFANIKDTDELEVSYKKAKKFGNYILVEKHVTGKDYRLVVFENELIFAIERVPAHIIGDGVATIEELILIENRKRKNTPSLALLTLDDDVLLQLNKNNYTKNSIPSTGSVIQLRSIANINTGGTPKPVLNIVHEDNKALVIQAANCIGLDLAGVDLLIPDISKSWKKQENQGFICEINAQPTLGSLTSSHLYPYLLQKLLPNKGKIPIIGVVESPSSAQYVKKFKEAFQAANMKVSCITSEENSEEFLGFYLDPKINYSMYEKASIASRNNQIQSVICELTPTKLLKDGLAFSYINLLLIDEYQFPDDSKVNSFSLISPILPMVEKKIYYHHSNKPNRPLFSRLEAYCKSRGLDLESIQSDKKMEDVINTINVSTFIKNS